jgi:hypothetical protein
MAAEDHTTQPTQDMPALGAEHGDGAAATSAGQSPWDAHAASESPGDPLPLAGAAFVGGFVLAKVLKKLGGGDD